MFNRYFQRKAVAVIRDNLQFTKLMPEAVIMQDSVMHALSILSGKGETARLVFSKNLRKRGWYC